MLREPDAVGGLIKDVPGLVHFAGCDTQHDWFAMTLTDGRGRALIGRQMHMMPFPFYQSLRNPRVHFQHYAGRMNEPRREQRRWRA
jgi:hypothetical protein